MQLNHEKKGMLLLNSIIEKLVDSMKKKKRICCQNRGKNITIQLQ